MTDDRELSDRDVSSAGGQSTYRPSEGEKPSIAVISAVSEHAGVEPLELPPLYDSVDADALDALFASLAAKTTPTTFRFHFDGHLVTVSGADDFSVRVEPLQGG